MGTLARTIINIRNNVTFKYIIYRTSPVTINKNFSNEAEVQPSALKFRNEQSSFEKSQKDFEGDLKMNDVLFEEESICGENCLITLNRPHSLNALQPQQCSRILEVLKEWELSKKLVIFGATGGKSFCAGGDLTILDHERSNLDLYFRTAYTLFYKTGAFKIPIVTLLQGLVMGGGAGIGIHAKYKVVTENTKFSMPETAIGYFPDGGCNYVFPRLKNYLGYFFGLTGYKLNGVDMIHMGMGTYFVPSDRLEDLKKELLVSSNADIEQIFNKYQKDVSKERFSLEKYRNKINYCFSAPTIEKIINRLEDDGSEWAKNVLNILNLKSPTSLKVTLQALQKGRTLNFKECLQMDFQLGYHFLSRLSDFYEGYKVTILEKGKKPIWNPKTLSDVTDEYIAYWFRPLPQEKILKL